MTRPPRTLREARAKAAERLDDDGRRKNWRR